MHEVDVYLNTLRGEGASKRKLYSAALSAWKKYTRENLFAIDADKKDVDGFIFWGEREEHWKSSTVIVYLVPLAQFFGQSGNERIRKYVLKRIRELRACMKTKHKRMERPMIFDTALEMLKIVRKIQHELCLWLLVVEGMSNRCLVNLRVGHIDPEKQTYKVPLDSGVESGRLHHYTMKIIQKYIDEASLNADDRLIGASERAIQKWVKKYAERTGLPEWKQITPNKLRHLGKNDELRQLLVREYERTEKVLEHTHNSVIKY